MSSIGSSLIAALALMALASERVTLAHYNRKSFKELVLNDNSNDDAIHMNAQQLLKRSGFKYQEHYTIAEDGYITQLIRIINPRADRARLKWPPVMMFHGASIDNTAYLISSSIQHHPERWPRVESDGPVTSWNRSLGFVLANNGYDVWLVGSRGSNKENQAYTNDVELARGKGRLFEPTRENYQLIRENRKQYWSYGLDDIIEYEIGAQIDTVLAATGAHEVYMFTFSLSTPTTMAFLAAHREYAHRIRVYIQMAPTIAADHFTRFNRMYFEKLCNVFPAQGIGYTPTYFAWPIARKLMIAASKSRQLRYSLVHQIINAFAGPSDKYHTNLERNLVAHLFQPVSFKSVQQYCQSSRSKKLNKFDYGTRRRKKKKPLEYDTSKLEVQNWVVISGTFDGLADPTTVQRLIETTQTPKPVTHIICSGFNHVDFLGAVENDKFVNLPVLELLNANSS